MNYLNLENKVAVVTGSARGIGKKIAETLSSQAPIKECDNLTKAIKVLRG